MGDYALALAKSGAPVKAIWTTIAFLGRYGRQPIDAVRALPMTEFQTLATEVGALMEAENEKGAMPGSD